MASYGKVLYAKSMAYMPLILNDKSITNLHKKLNDLMFCSFTAFKNCYENFYSSVLRLIFVSGPDVLF